MTETGSPLDREGNLIALLDASRGGCEDSRAALTAHLLHILRGYIERRMHPAVRAGIDPQDVVQDAVLRFLHDAPRFTFENGAAFRALVYRIADNALRDRHRYFQAKRRELARERPLSGATSVLIDSSTPSRGCVKDEAQARIRLALEMLDLPDQKLICMRVYDSRPFREIAEELDLRSATVRKRFERALQRLHDKVLCLERGDVHGFVS